jgi:hypothetical protein
MVGAVPVLAVVHDCIPGRVRWQVCGLRGDAALKAVLEDGLVEMPGVYRASASIETGNLLVLWFLATFSDWIDIAISSG